VLHNVRAVPQALAHGSGLRSGLQLGSSTELGLGSISGIYNVSMTILT